MPEPQQVEECPAPVERVVARQPIVGRDDRIVGFQLLHRPTPRDESPAVTAETVTVSALLGDLSLDVDALVGGTQLYRPAGDLVTGTGLVPPPGRPTVLVVPGELCTEPGVGARCRLLRGIGYWLALDVLAWQPELEPLLPELDVVRVDLSRASRDDVVDLVVRCASYDVNLLAASCLTEDDLTWAADAGFGLFQGPAVQRPVQVSGTTLAPSSLARVQLATELLDDRLDFARVEAILNHEPALVVQVLKQASLGAGGGLRREVHSVRDALVLMGTTRIRQWAALTVLGRQVSSNRTDALAVALVRARMCELLSQAHGIDRGFAFTAGLLSALDRLLGVPIEEVEQSVDVDEELALAAFRRKGALGELVGSVADYQDAVAAGEPAGSVPGDTGLVAAMAFCWAMSHVNVGVQLPEVERFVPGPEYLDLARRAEAAGFDSVWVGDHLVYDLPDGSTRGPYEAWTTLAAIAAATERVEIGPLVASTGFHAPAMLAKQAATVDAISQGRLIVGLGAGWNRREFDAFGFPYDRRVSRFEEALAIIVPLLREGQTTFHGRFYDVDDCVLDPRPVREGGPPIMLGSTSPRMLGIGLPVVDAWNVWWSLYDNAVDKFAQLKAGVDAVMPEGRSVEATAAVLVTLPGGRGRLMGETYDASVTTVTPDDLAVHVQGMAAAGATHLQLVLDPITAESIDTVGEVLADLDR